MKIDKNKPETLIIRTNKYIGIETPLENGDAIFTKIYGNWNAYITPIPDEEEEQK